MSDKYLFPFGKNEKLDTELNRDDSFPHFPTEEELEKARTVGSKDKQPRKKRGTKEVEAPTMDTFKEIARNAKDVDDFVDKVRQIKNVPAELSQKFFNEYNPKGDLDIKQTSKKFLEAMKKSEELEKGGPGSGRKKGSGKKLFDQIPKGYKNWSDDDIKQYNRITDKMNEFNDAEKPVPQKLIDAGSEIARKYGEALKKSEELEKGRGPDKKPRKKRGQGKKEENWPGKDLDMERYGKKPGWKDKPDWPKPIGYGKTELDAKDVNMHALKQLKEKHGDKMSIDTSKKGKVVVTLKKSDNLLDDLFKSVITEEFEKAKYIKREGGPGNYKYTYADNKGGGSKEGKPMDPQPKMVQDLLDAQARGNKKIGQTKSGKPIYAAMNHSGHRGFSGADHLDAANLHITLKDEAGKKYMSKEGNKEHLSEIKRHSDASKYHEQKAKEFYSNIKFTVEDLLENAKKVKEKKKLNKADQPTDPREKEAQKEVAREQRQKTAPFPSLKKRMFGAKDKKPRSKKISDKRWEAIKDKFKQQDAPKDIKEKDQRSVIKGGPGSGRKKGVAKEDSAYYLKQKEHHESKVKFHTQESHREKDPAVKEHHKRMVERHTERLDTYKKLHAESLKKSKGPGSRGGKVIGHTKSGKPIYDSFKHQGHSKFSTKDHKDAYEAHMERQRKLVIQTLKEGKREDIQDAFSDSSKHSREHAKRANIVKKSLDELVEHFMKADKIKGGFADKNKPKDFDKKQLEMGIKIEMEHTKDKDKAREIAMDHLKEIPDYYTRLKKLEAKAEKEGMKKDAKKVEKAAVPRENVSAFYNPTEGELPKKKKDPKVPETKDESDKAKKEKIKKALEELFDMLK